MNIVDYGTWYVITYHLLIPPGISDNGYRKIYIPRVQIKSIEDFFPSMPDPLNTHYTYVTEHRHDRFYRDIFVYNTEYRAQPNWIITTL